jgi:hypothetical protein
MGAGVGWRLSLRDNLLIQNFKRGHTAPSRRAVTLVFAKYFQSTIP